MARNRRKFSPEFKEEAAKMVVDTSESIAHVARELKMKVEFLSKAAAYFAAEHR